MAKPPVPGFKQDDNGDWYLPWDFPAWQAFIEKSDEDDDEDDPHSAPVIALFGEGSESEEVIAAQTAALEYTKANEEKIKKAILEVLLPFYQKWRELEQKEMGDYGEFGPDGEYPELNSIEGLERVFSFEGIFLTEEIDDGMARVGYAFSSEVEDEHGIGVVTCRDKVLGVGFQDMSWSGDLTGSFDEDWFNSMDERIAAADNDEDSDEDETEGMSEEEMDSFNDRVDDALDHIMNMFGGAPDDDDDDTDKEDK